MFSDSKLAVVGVALFIAPSELEGECVRSELRNAPLDCVGDKAVFDLYAFCANGAVSELKVDGAERPLADFGGGQIFSMPESDDRPRHQWWLSTARYALLCGRARSRGSPC